jgi:hypothetical protein
MSLTIAELGLSEPALTGATLLLAAHPAIVFTSGRRDVTSQARAMASNVVSRRQWIAQTYRRTPESAALQHWINSNPAAVTQAAIAIGLAGVMADWTDAQKGRLSKHFSGEAFDLQPMAEGPAADAVKAAIHALPGAPLFLEHEGGLLRWHVQFG